MVVLCHLPHPRLQQEVLSRLSQINMASLAGNCRTAMSSDAMTTKVVMKDRSTPMQPLLLRKVQIIHVRVLRVKSKHLCPMTPPLPSSLTIILLEFPHMIFQELSLSQEGVALLTRHTQRDRDKGGSRRRKGPISPTGTLVTGIN